MHVRTHRTGSRHGCEKGSLKIIIIEQMCLEGGFKRGGGTRVAECFVFTQGVTNYAGKCFVFTLGVTNYAGKYFVFTQGVTNYAGKCFV